MMKLLWNIQKKKDNLWVRWIDSYYIKGHDVMLMEAKEQHSWIFKAILQQRVVANGLQGWIQWQTYSTRLVYKQVMKVHGQAPWYRLFCRNSARPQALFILWTACHGKLATRNRLFWFGMVDYTTCCFCLQEETMEHLLFECLETKTIWKQVLLWLNCQHEPLTWNQEMMWLIQNCRGKSIRSDMLKLAIAETVYGIWMYRNSVSFGKDVDRLTIGTKIIDIIVYRGWVKLKLRPHIARLVL
ncbi:uncharacterized protein LOC131624890 [Vicia villosa]|uniref:uncharacterized protein LOC131624890 n=1 Tax=Vicia villosa TaxID=3911 RepID=UPI00273BBA76|nr:uncharacterized protein LOC131624890 [Vicia villosa]